MHKFPPPVVQSTPPQTYDTLAMRDSADRGDGGAAHVNFEMSVGEILGSFTASPSSKAHFSPMASTQKSYETSAMTNTQKTFETSASLSAQVDPVVGIGAQGMTRDPDGGRGDRREERYGSQRHEEPQDAEDDDDESKSAIYARPSPIVEQPQVKAKAGSKAAGQAKHLGRAKTKAAPGPAASKLGREQHIGQGKSAGLNESSSLDASFETSMQIPEKNSTSGSAQQIGLSAHKQQQQRSAAAKATPEVSAYKQAMMRQQGANNSTSSGGGSSLGGLGGRKPGGMLGGVGKNQLAQLRSNPLWAIKGGAVSDDEIVDDL